MAIKIQQGYKYQGEDWWEWWVWLEGSEQELNQVDHVVYVLHPTFPTPVRTINDRSTKFRLQTTGWGVFLIRAQVVSKSGQETSLTHQLVLGYPDGTRTSA